MLTFDLDLQGCTNLTLLNRSRPRAETLAAAFPEVHFDIRLMADLMRVVSQSDVVFVASGSESILIHGQDLRGIPAARESVGGIRRFFDISVPRNVAADVSDVECSRVFNVDDLKEVGTFKSSLKEQSLSNDDVHASITDKVPTNAQTPRWRSSSWSLSFVASHQVLRSSEVQRGISETSESLAKFF